MLLSCSLGSLGFVSGCDVTRKKKARQEDRSSVTQRRTFSDSLGSLWRDYFNDPLQWWDIRNTKTKPSSPDFKHKISKQALWIYGCYNPSWVQEELRRLGLLLPERGGGEFDVNKAKKVRVNGFDCTEQQAEGDEEEEEDAFSDADDAHQRFHVHNEEIALVALFKACAQQKDLHRGIRIHCYLVERELEKNAFLGSSLISMYAKCGALEEAQDVFDDLPVRNVVSWSALIAGYAHLGHGEEALICFDLMQSGGFSPNAVTFVCILKACASMEAFEKGQEIHAQILRKSLLDKNVVVATALLDMYVKCDALDKAQDLFSELPFRNGVSWNVLIAGYAQQGHNERALECYELMQAEGFCPDAITFACIFKACGCIGALDKGQYLHAQIMRECLLVENTVVASAVVDMYTKCGAVGRAQQMFDKLQIRSVGLWNALITGYARHGEVEKALNCLKQMHLEGISPDEVTFVCILKACSSMAAADEGQDIHAQIVSEGLLEKSITVTCTLIDMYAKCGALDEAQEVFDEALVRSVVLWNVLIGGYAQQGYDEEALKCFEQMQLDGFSPDAVTFACILKACGSTGSSYKGQKLHTEIATFGLLENVIVGTSLVDMYANCGMLVEAKAAFENLSVRDVVSWSALMVGYAQLGKADTVFNLFNKMVRDGTKPNSVTFSIVLNACSHSGLLDCGQLYFELISERYQMTPTLEHHNSVVDLFGRIGLLEMAISVIQAMPILANVTIWHTLLGACGKWGHWKFGRQAFKRSVQMDGIYPAAFVGISNISAGSGGVDILKALQLLCMEEAST